MTFFMIGGVMGKDWEKFSPGLQHFLIFMSILTILLGVVLALVQDVKQIAATISTVIKIARYRPKVFPFIFLLFKPK